MTQIEQKQMVIDLTNSIQDSMIKKSMKEKFRKTGMDLKFVIGYIRLQTLKIYGLIVSGKSHGENVLKTVIIQ